MKVMSWGRVVGCMATEAKVITAFMQFSGMRIMAIGTLHAGMKHFTLCERTILIIFITDLAISEIILCADDLWDQVIQDFI